MDKVMGSPVRFILILAVALSVAGCYTQLGTVRDGEEYEDVDRPYAEKYSGKRSDSTARVINDYYFGASFGGFYPSARYRFGFSFYYPSYYWSWYDPYWCDPFYWRWYYPFYYDPWICGTPFIVYGYPWYYRTYWFGYPYYWGRYYYYPRIYIAVDDAFRGTRNFGSTRGTVGRSRTAGATRDASYVPPPATPRGGTPAVTGTPSSRGDRPSVNTNAERGRAGDRRGTETMRDRGSPGEDRRGGGRTGGRDIGSRRGDRENVRRYYISPPRFVQPTDPPQQNNPGENRSDRSWGGGRREGSDRRESYSPPAPQQSPSYSPPPSGGSSGGDRGGSGGSRSGGSGGRSGGSTRGGR